MRETMFTAEPQRYQCMGDGENASGIHEDSGVGSMH